MLSRRDLFSAALALSAANSLPVRASTKTATDPFRLGIASGEPTPDGIVLWTRLAPEPFQPGGGLPNANIPVRWQISHDESFRHLARSGAAMATPMLAHSVHVELTGLRPARWYWYRFQALGHRSQVGRFKTAPAPAATPARLRLAFASCQQWTQGLFTAYQHLAAEDLDLVLHLGDYIYEQGYRGGVRPDGQSETFSLNDYRARHALYKSDPLLQLAHARFPWMVTWDDHEVSNNYAADIHEKGQPRAEFLERRASAYQAYYEHMPLRLLARPQGSRMLLHRRLDFGRLARIHMLDTRQHRTDQPCGDGLKTACSDLNNPAQTLLGPVQEAWLRDGLHSSSAIWDVLAQQVLMTLQDFDPSASAEVFNMDSWSGYPLARQRLVDLLAARAKANTIVLTGDVHSSWVGQLHTEPQDISSPCVAAEFVGTSISSGGDGFDTHERVERMLPANPQIRYFHARRGYVRCDITPTLWRADYRIVPFVTRPGAPVTTHASFAVTPGRLIVEKA
jgi:alkaline phosphatase D